ncbi:MAG: exodeoxyribonuclease large subunit [Acidimicrobiaceae bacterium]|jgi:exodeoxyribonuclease VII large subunit|nr:exodeoxyribonuclease large subunit [Acidimicrobiaceae bacterium]
MSQPSFDLDFDSGFEPTYRVSELADAINQVLKRGFHDGIWVRGEIEGLQRRGNGHLYFNLSDETDSGKATVPVALFANVAVRLRAMLNRHRLRLENGLRVRIHGTLDFYAPQGRLSLKMDGLDPTFTLGQLAAERDRVLQSLTAAGLLERNGRLRLPVAPVRVGVVTSLSGAAWHDFRHELETSGFSFHITVVDGVVQGASAPAAVVGAIHRLARHAVDVIVIIRGGGSRTDLAAFDDEGIARAIAACPVPVLTGLGHEIDRSIADEAAHTALKTPTACAAHIVDRTRQFVDAVESAWSAVAVSGVRALDHGERRLADRARRISSRTHTAVELADQRLSHHAINLARRVPRCLDDLGNNLAHAEARVRAHDPQRALARGWSVTRTADGRLVRDAASLAEGDEIVTTLSGGDVRSRVDGPV